MRNVVSPSLLIELSLSSFLIGGFAPPLWNSSVFNENIVRVFAWLLGNDSLIPINIEARRIVFHGIHFFFLRKIEGVTSRLL